MSAARLILIEGMIGSGKTTTAGWLEGWLSGRGEDARAFREFDEDQPIRTRAVDQLRAAAARAAQSLTLTVSSRSALGQSRAWKGSMS